MSQAACGGGMFLGGAADDPDWGALARLRASLPGVAAAVAARPGRLLLLAFGRFPAARRLFAAGAAAMASGSSTPPARAAGEVLAGVEALAAVAALRRDGLSTGASLPPATVAEIRAYAESNPGYGGPGWRTPVPPGGLAEAERRAGARILAVNLPHADRECPAVARVVRDGWLRAVAAGYLGAAARVTDVRLFWSLPARGAGRAELSRVAQDTFHFDLGDWAQLKAFFYLTDVDAETGAHVYVRGSHARRPLSHQFTPFSAKTERQIAAAYGADSILTVVGPAGFGFVEDPFGFHTGSSVRHGRRLVLEITFGITGPPRGGAAPGGRAAG